MNVFLAKGGSASDGPAGADLMIKPRRRAYSPTFPPALRSLRPRWRRQAPVHSGPESVF